MKHRLAAIAILAAVLCAAAPADGARAETSGGAALCERRAVPLAEAAAWMERCADFAEPRFLVESGGSPAALMTDADLAAAEAAGARTVCPAGAVRLPDVIVPAEVRFEARLIAARDEEYLPRVIAAAAWRVRTAGDEWGAPERADGWTFEIPPGAGWMRLPDALIRAGRAEAALSVRFRIDRLGRPWFAAARPGNADIPRFGAEPPSVVNAAAAGGARAGVHRLARGAEPVVTAPIGVRLSEPPPAGFVAAYREHVRAAHARTLVLHWGVEFDPATGATAFGVPYRGRPWPSHYGMASAFHVGGGDWITAAHGMFKGRDPDYWLTADGSPFWTMYGAEENGRKAGLDAVQVRIDARAVIGRVSLDAWSVAGDVALLRGIAPPRGGVLELARRDARPGDAVMTVRGDIAAVAADHSRAEAHHAGDIAIMPNFAVPGMSGGPLLGDCGRVIGMARGRTTYPPAQTWAVPVSALLDMLPALRAGLRE